MFSGSTPPLILPKICRSLGGVACAPENYVERRRHRLGHRHQSLKGRFISFETKDRFRVLAQPVEKIPRQVLAGFDRGQGRRDGSMGRSASRRQKLDRVRAAHY
jgi:hypothetical protein